MTSEQYRLSFGTHNLDFFGATIALRCYLENARGWREDGHQTHFTAVPDAGYDW